jgi:D-alanine-D-alanine ligase
MKKKITLALLSGGNSPEREVSINSGNQVYEALDKEKYEVLRYDPKTDIPRLVADAQRIDAALIILHGPYGEDGTIQGLLELLDIPYQGSGVIGSAVAMNKLVSKQLYSRFGIPTPSYLAIKKGDPVDADTLVSRFELPMVIKPNECGSSVGMSIVKTKEQIMDAFEKAFAHDHTVMVEEYIEGLELTAGVMGNDTLEAFPVIEIIPDADHEFFDYEAKYTAGVTQEICPARIDDTLTEKAQTLARMAHTALACRGYSRTDMILRNNEILVLETNTIPGMTATSLLPQAAKVGGYSFPQLLDKLIELGMENR